MPSESLSHWLAYWAVEDIVKMAPIPPEEQGEFFGKCYDRIRAALEEFEIRNEQMLERLKPLDN